ncbi:uncharacterized protein LOC133910017 [Phragmites australis]|uniref:uncharacterized protein LOC133910017 n=1 Tax=Phragmites australis TaxID=29695 RepID=UPI002D7932BF|nr:uncharacterized protein LOC133910017 [Phragmites australis]XP_062208524.1 uncharacterized protein LOC133910017 [Phragmites australis]
MDPYDFPEGGCRCTITITRLILTTPWWFPSCNRCNRACTPSGDGYKCNTCSCTGYRFKYKLSFIANDGTAEAEMIAFGEVARRIVGKPVQQVLRSARFANDTPPDIAAIVSLKFAFAVALTEQSYYNPKRTYQITSIVASYGRQHTVPHIKLNQPKQLPICHTADPILQQHTYSTNPDATLPDGSVPSGIKSGASSSQPETQKTPTKDIPADNTPPPPLEYDESPLKKPVLPDPIDLPKHSSARKRLFEDTTDPPKEDTDTQKKSNKESLTAKCDPILHSTEQSPSRASSQQTISSSTKMCKSKTAAPKNKQ